MNKQELIEIVSEENAISKAQAARIVDSIFSNIVKAVAAGETFQMIGFGTFKAVERAAREARNPATGAVVQVPATVTPKFVAGAGFKNAVK